MARYLKISCETCANRKDALECYYCNKWSSYKRDEGMLSDPNTDIEDSITPEKMEELKKEEKTRMTYLELYMSKHPDMSKENIINARCPDCEYADAVRYEGCTCGNDYEDCLKCWNREIPKYQNEVNTPHVAIGEAGSIPKILDSGNRREFETGAVRDIQEGKGRCDLLPLDVVAQLMDDSILRSVSLFQYEGTVGYLFTALADFAARWDDNLTKGEVDIIIQRHSTMILEVAKQFEEGAKKYGEDNWQKGIPVRCYIDSAVRHYLKCLRGDKDEPHDRAFVWNLMCAIWTCKHKPELNDYKKED